MFPASREHPVEKDQDLDFALGEDEALHDHEVMNFFVIIIFIEHSIVIFKAFLEEYIEDVPSFVIKRSIKVQH